MGVFFPRPKLYVDITSCNTFFFRLTNKNVAACRQETVAYVYVTKVDANYELDDQQAKELKQKND